MAGRRLRSAGKAKKGIPIPSFSCVSPSAESLKWTATEATPPNDTVVTPDWNKPWLLRAEAALHTQRVRRGASKWSKHGLLRLDDFYTLARQLAVAETSKHIVEDPNNLSMPERYLCDLVSAASPSLYNLVQNDGGGWCLKIVDFQGNRIEELRRLLRQTELQVSKRDAILNKILQHQSLQKKVAPQQLTLTPTEKEAPQKIIVEPYIRPDMSLEDRVRARAEAKQQRNISTTSTTPNHSSLLRLADAMWSHSRHILRKQAQVSVKTANRICVTVEDAVHLFARSLLERGTQQVHREKATRLELLQALRDLQKLVPEWISFSSPDLSKHTTIWLVPTVDYKSVRTKLGAPTNSGTKRVIGASNNAKQSIHHSASATPEKPPPRVSISPSTSAVESPSKKQRTGTTVSLKRPPAETLVIPKPKRKRELRINKLLILTDADYDGGMIMEPTIDESPRGLKRLFYRMNSGKRI
jgi:hypothetical protein